MEIKEINTSSINRAIKTYMKMEHSMSDFNYYGIRDKNGKICLDFEIDVAKDEYVDDTFDELINSPKDSSLTKRLITMFDFYKIPITNIDIKFSMEDWGGTCNFKIYIDMNKIKVEDINIGFELLGCNFDMWK